MGTRSSALPQRRPTVNRATGVRPRRPGLGPGALLLLVAPSVILLIALNAYPLGYGFFQSLHDGSLITTGPWAGLGNYAHILKEARFWSAAEFTLIFTLVGVFGSWLVGLCLALLLRAQVPGRTIFKVLLMLPWVIPIVVSSTALNWLIATRSSPIPELAHALGFGYPLFLSDPTLAKITVCVFKVWVSFPFMMLMMSSALASVDTTLYEAAGVDGASRWQQLRHITLPMTARSSYVSWIIMMIFCVNDFPSIFLLTGGGPENSTESLIVLSYRSVFQDFHTGDGVSIAFVMTAVLVVVSVILYRRIRRAETA